MTTVLSQKGQLVLPALVRERLNLAPGDDFEVTIEDEDTLSLRRVTRPANRGLVDLLLGCPGSFTVPPRERDDSRPLSL
ncbi:MAG: AbrB/MazE/SpoVT family DNA-binding domain-containing protein [Opitutaceae bacterium]|nr:AbrB/MazE/SpoVT family DNA-binding domain-containing protein [Opitutaceae bacterium]